MPTIIEVIKRLLPHGTRSAEQERSWKEVPFWPPDLFAVAATLVEMSECYSHPRYTGPTVGKANQRFFDERYLRRVTRQGDNWHQEGVCSKQVQILWSKLLGQKSEVSSWNPPPNPAPILWWDLAMELMAIADEASKGFGFLQGGSGNGKNNNEQLSDYVAVALLEYKKLYRKFKDNLDRRLLQLEYLPISLCIMVPPQEVCVQPKSRTPQVGCTLRSFSHNLALLPSFREVKTRWDIGNYKGQDAQKPFNLLIIPFPYLLPGGSFKKNGPFPLPPLPKGQTRSAHFFSIEQKWLAKLSAKVLTKFIKDLIKRAAEEVGEVHGVVLPELALNHDYAEHIKRELSKISSLELFIAGVLKPNQENGLFGTNTVSGCTFGSQGDFRLEWEQRKHHRWKLDRDQIRRYHMGYALDPSLEWWEMIDIRERECFFTVFRPGACLATLVCEDLARIDPVQTALRAIGPNLLIALLMDGPQKKDRWSSRYATVLAEDPGSAVLTLTCLGMVRRSYKPGELEPRQIALWKDASGRVEELKLPKGGHGLVLTISSSDVRSDTMDSRSDGGATVNLFLSGIHEVRVVNPPAGLTE